MLRLQAAKSVPAAKVFPATKVDSAAEKPARVRVLHIDANVFLNVVVPVDEMSLCSSQWCVSLSLTCAPSASL